MENSVDILDEVRSIMEAKSPAEQRLWDVTGEMAEAMETTSLVNEPAVGAIYRHAFHALQELIQERELGTEDIHSPVESDIFLCLQQIEFGLRDIGKPKRQWSHFPLLKYYIQCLLGIDTLLEEAHERNHYE